MLLGMTPWYHCPWRDGGFSLQQARRKDVGRSEMANGRLSKVARRSEPVVDVHQDGNQIMIEQTARTGYHTKQGYGVLYQRKTLTRERKAYDPAVWYTERRKDHTSDLVKGNEVRSDKQGFFTGIGV